MGRRSRATTGAYGNSAVTGGGGLPRCVFQGSACRRHDTIVRTGFRPPKCRRAPAGHGQRPIPCNGRVRLTPQPAESSTAVTFADHGQNLSPLMVFASMSDGLPSHSSIVISAHSMSFGSMCQE